VEAKRQRLEKPQTEKSKGPDENHENHHFSSNRSRHRSWRNLRGSGPGGDRHQQRQRHQHFGTRVEENHQKAQQEGVHQRSGGHSCCAGQVTSSPSSGEGPGVPLNLRARRGLAVLIAYHVTNMDTVNREIASLGGGCFWCLEAVYQQTSGVSSAVSGYMGGAHPNPTYQEVCSGRSGHVEVVQVTFDPGEITYREILEIFFTIHDPTTLNRQGNDVGTQYRSVIFYHSPEQQAAASEIVRELTAEKAFDSPIVTAVEPASTFFAAEDYHQRYFENNADQPYCTYVVSPKVAKFRRKFAGRVKGAAASG
jgi:peptide-methionine (S)-S-oxide reductase